MCSGLLWIRKHVQLQYTRYIAESHIHFSNHGSDTSSYPVIVLNRTPISDLMCKDRSQGISEPGHGIFRYQDWKLEKLFAYYRYGKQIRPSLTIAYYETMHNSIMPGVLVNWNANLIPRWNNLGMRLEMLYVSGWCIDSYNVLDSFPNHWPCYVRGLHEQSTNHISLIKQA